MFVVIEPVALFPCHEKDLGHSAGGGSGRGAKDQEQGDGQQKSEKDLGHGEGADGAN